MRISDWSSDVCSSDLGAQAQKLVGAVGTGGGRLKLFKRLGECYRRHIDGQVGPVDSVQLLCVRMHMHQGLRWYRAVQQGIALHGAFRYASTHQQDQVGVCDVLYQGRIAAKATIDHKADRKNVAEGNGVRVRDTTGASSS